MIVGMDSGVIGRRDVYFLVFEYLSGGFFEFMEFKVNFEEEF